MQQRKEIKNLPLTEVEIGYLFTVLNVFGKNLEKTNSKNINDRLIDRLQQLTEYEL